MGMSNNTGDGFLNSSPITYKYTVLNITLVASKRIYTLHQILYPYFIIFCFNSISCIKISEATAVCFPDREMNEYTETLTSLTGIQQFSEDICASSFQCFFKTIYGIC